MRLSFSNKNIDLSFPGSLSSGSLTLFNNSDLVDSSFMLERERERLTAAHARQSTNKFINTQQHNLPEFFEFRKVYHTPYTLLPISFLKVCCLNRFSPLVKVEQSIRVQLKELFMHVFRRRVVGVYVQSLHMPVYGWCR
jgi:hypothetical protein